MDDSRDVNLRKESRAVVRRPHDAAAVLFGLKSNNNIHYKQWRNLELGGPWAKMQGQPSNSKGSFPIPLSPYVTSPPLCDLVPRPFSPPSSPPLLRF